MLLRDFEGKRTIIWGAGREGRAAALWLEARFPGMPLTFVDEGKGAPQIVLEGRSYEVVRVPASIQQVLCDADIVIKSPGVSRYHPFITSLSSRVKLTSLLNMWAAENAQACIVGITGTKGKSTAATLLNHVLLALGKKSVLLGNIGTPVSESRTEEADIYVVEVSSFQAADFYGRFAVAALVSLYPEHIDWHRSLETYYKDKANILQRADWSLIDQTALRVLSEHSVSVDGADVFNAVEGFHVQDDLVFDGAQEIGNIENAFLNRAHNRGNVCAVLAVLKALGLDPAAALRAMKDYKGLRHRQYELGQKDGVLYVDDSISTTPQSAMAALEAYADRPVTLILGGFDRGLDYEELVAYIRAKGIHAVVCIGQTGPRILSALTAAGAGSYHLALSMAEAVEKAKSLTPSSGVVLLSPAAPSFDMFADYVERACAFSEAAGFNAD